MQNILHTPRLILEPVTPSHTHALYTGLSDPHLYTFLPNTPPASATALASFFASRKAPGTLAAGEDWFNWAIRLKTTSTVSGLLDLFIQPDNTAKLSCFIFQPFWQQGYAQEACRHVIATLPARGVTHLIAEVDSRNTPSRNLLESLGFQHTQTIENADFFKNHPSDECIYKLGIYE